MLSHFFFLFLFAVVFVTCACRGDPWRRVQVLESLVCLDLFSLDGSNFTTPVILVHLGIDPESLQC